MCRRGGTETTEHDRAARDGRRRRIFGDQRGLTVIELLVAMVMCLAVSGAAFSALETGTRAQLRDQAYADEVTTAQTGIARLLHDLRQATTILDAQPNRIEFLMPVQGSSPQVTLDVRYDCGASDSRTGFTRCARVQATQGTTLPAIGAAAQSTDIEHVANGTIATYCNGAGSGAVGLGVLLQQPEHRQHRHQPVGVRRELREPRRPAARLRPGADPGAGERLAGRRRNDAHDRAQRRRVPAQLGPRRVMRRRLDPRRLAAADGFTVIEVLVASVILIVGVLGVFGALDSARVLALVSERQTSLAHRAQQELERLQSMPYAAVAMTAAPPAASGCPSPLSAVYPTSPDCYVNGGALVYDRADTSKTEPLAIDATAGTITPNGTGTGCTDGCTATWTDGRLSGEIFDFVSWTSDPNCASGAICSASNDYKRVTVVVTLAGAKEPSQPTLVSTLMANPDALPTGAPANSAQNPLQGPTTQCGGSTCNQALNGTAVDMYLTDSPAGGSYGPPTVGNTLHQTLVDGDLRPRPAVRSDAGPADHHAADDGRRAAAVLLDRQGVHPQ